MRAWGLSYGTTSFVAITYSFRHYGDLGPNRSIEFRVRPTRARTKWACPGSHGAPRTARCGLTHEPTRSRKAESLRGYQGANLRRRAVPCRVLTEGRSVPAPSSPSGIPAGPSVKSKHGTPGPVTEGEGGNRTAASRCLRPHSQRLPHFVQCLHLWVERPQASAQSGQPCRSYPSPSV